ncbi:MAG: hypothetical protein NT062_02525 [Proteobacteria bacterium]|nr:hypothetical protein [Pseudomonadota bacterium]
MAGEPRCPFCGVEIAPVRARDTTLGRVSRAVIFASATLAACGGAATSREVEEPRHHGGGGCTDPDPAEIARLEKQRQEAATEDDKRALDAELQRAKMPVCMPYGAPTARRRVV